MIRFLRLLVGIPLTAISVIICLAAIAMLISGNRAAAILTGLIGILLFIFGRRLTARSAPQRSVTTLMHSETRDAITGSLQFVDIGSDNCISVSASTAAEAKAAIKELRLIKKSFQLKKQQIVAHQKAHRAAHTNDVRTRGSKMRGGGKFGRFVRSVQTASRDAARSQLAHNLEPLEIEKQRMEPRGHPKYIARATFDNYPTSVRKPQMNQESNHGSSQSA